MEGVGEIALPPTIELGGQRRLGTSMTQALKKYAVFACILWAATVSCQYLTIVPMHPAALLHYFGLMNDRATSGGGLPLHGYLLSLLGALLIGMSAFGWGTMTSRWLEGISAAEKRIFSIGLGFSFLIVLLCTFGIFGILYRPLIGFLLIPGLISAVRQRPWFKISLRPHRPDLHWLDYVLVALAFLMVGYVFIGVLAPEIFVDALAYHLPLPDLWLKHHRIFSLPGVHASYFPLQIHSLYAASLALGNEITVKTLNFFFGLLVAFTMFIWSKKYFTARQGALSVFLFLSTPLVAMVMSRTSIEMPRAFFELLALLAAMNTVFIPRYRIRWIVISAIFCGVAMGGHYFGGYCCLSAGTVILCGALRSGTRIRKIGMFAALFVLISGLFIVPLLVRNYRVTGVATYPFGYTLGNLAHNNISFTPLGHRQFVENPRPVPRTLKNLLLLPWYVTMQDKVFHQEPFSGMAFLMLLPLLLPAVLADRRMRYLALYAGVYYLCWFTVRSNFRFILPCLPVLGLLLSSGIVQIYNAFCARQIFLGLMAIAGVSNLLFYVEFEHRVVNPWPVVSGAQSRDEFLSLGNNFYYQTISYPAIAWINRNLPQDAKVLFVGEARPYYCHRTYLFSGIGDINPLVSFARECSTARDLFDRLHREKITHILVNLAEPGFNGNYGSMEFDKRSLAVTDAFWKRYLREIYRGIADVSVINKGVYSAKKQLPQLWSTYASNPRNYVYVYKIATEDALAQSQQLPYSVLRSTDVFSPEQLRNWTSAGANRSQN
jgi:hypothetical protein